MPSALLHTDRLVLTPWLGTALDDALRVWTDPDVRRYLFDGRTIPPAEAEALLAASQRDFDERGYGIWGLTSRATGALCGFAGCRPWPDGPPELLYGLLPAWQGRGLATEAGAAVLAHVFEQLGHREVFAATDPPNEASVRVMTRLGLAFDRRTEMHGLDTLVYRVSRERWRRLRAATDRP
ncbi:MAG: GNAT family N-acetyltransferase [Vicinamibacterales bacterium]